MNIGITPVNDPPTSSDDTVTTAEDTTKVLAITDFGTYSDTEDSAIAAVKITTLESNGSLEFHNGSAWVAVTLNQEISKADIDAGKLRFVPDADENGTGYASIGFKVSDGTDFSTSASTLTVHVTPVNDTPTLSQATGNTGNANDQVFEKALASGSNPSSTAETVTGTLTLGDLDGLDDIQSLTFDPAGGIGAALTIGTGAGEFATLGAMVGQSFTTTNGRLTLTSYNTGVFSYSFELTSPTADGAGTEQNSFRATLSDGAATASATVTIDIVDDVPTANPDALSITEGTTASPAANLTGNVFASGATGDVADRQGADSRADPVVKVIAGNAVPSTAVIAGTTSANGTQVTGSYGTLTLGADGSYSYDLDDNNASANALKNGDSMTEVFSYRITDADGDTSDTTLTITLNGTSDGAPAIGPVDGNGAATGETSVSEAGLVSGDSETTTASVTISALDGLTKISVGGTEVSAVQLGNLSTTPVIIDTGEGTLTLTGYSSTSAVGGITTGGTLSYSYTLKANLDHSGATESSDPIALIVTDRGGSTSNGTLTVRIVDDVPLANPDARNITEGTASSPAANLTGNVFASGATGDVADRQGADSRADPVVKVIAGNAVPSTAVIAGTTSANGTQVTGSYGTLTLGADGSYSYDLDDNNASANALKNGDSMTEVFSYRITDADGDTSDTTLTITLNGTSDGAPAIGPVDGNGAAAGEVTVSEAGLVSGDSETTTGSITISALDGLDKIEVGGTEVTAARLTDLSQSPLAIDTGEGTLTLTGYSSTSAVGGITTGGTLSYSYTLKANLDHSGATESSDPIALTLTDEGNGTATGTLRVQIIDDVPLAIADTDSVSEDGPLVATGNVLTGTDIASGNDSNRSDGVADIPGADTPAIVTGLAAGTQASASGNLDNPVRGLYGSLILNSNGTYSYSLDNANPAVQALGLGETLTDTFSYSIADADGDGDGDGDGDASVTQISIIIDGANDAPVAVDNSSSVTEDSGIPARGNVLTDNQGGLDQDIDTSDTLAVNTIRTGAEAGRGTAGVAGTALTGAYGSLTLNADGTYSYALDNGNPRIQALEIGDTLTDTFTYSVSDGHGGSDSAELIIRIQGAHDPVMQEPSPPSRPTLEAPEKYEPDEFTGQWPGPYEPQYLRTDQFGSGSDLPSNQYVHHSVNDDVAGILRQYGNGEPNEVVRYNGIESLLAVAQELNTGEDRFNFLTALNEVIPGQESLRFDNLDQIRDELQRRAAEAAFIDGLTEPPAAGVPLPEAEPAGQPGNGWNDRMDDEQRSFLKRMSQ